MVKPDSVADDLAAALILPVIRVGTSSVSSVAMAIRQAGSRSPGCLEPPQNCLVGVG